MLIAIWSIVIQAFDDGSDYALILNSAEFAATTGLQEASMSVTAHLMINGLASPSGCGREPHSV